MKDSILNAERFVHQRLCRKMEEKGDDLYHYSPPGLVEVLREQWEEIRTLGDRTRIHEDPWQALREEIAEEFEENKDKFARGDYIPKFNPNYRSIDFEFEPLKWTKEQTKEIRQIFKELKNGGWDRIEDTYLGESKDRYGLWSPPFIKKFVLSKGWYHPSYSESGAYTGSASLAFIKPDTISIPLKCLDSTTDRIRREVAVDCENTIHFGNEPHLLYDNSPQYFAFLEMVGEEVFGVSEF